MKRLVAAIIVAGVFMIPSVARADPDFGPGNSNKGPQDPGALCHPPGHEPDAPCK